MKRPIAMRVIFCTYQSADVIKESFSGMQFDLIIFDEAHRTAGKQDKSFALAHHDENINSAKRLYMTATPRMYNREGVTDGYSMDDYSIFGRRFHELKFSKAIDTGILSDYKVVGLRILADDLDKARADAGEADDFTLEEECKLASIYKSIKQQDESLEPNLLQRILVFHNKIPQSKRFEIAFPKIVKRMDGEGVDVRHIDGNSRARDRASTIEWLKRGESDVRIISNVRCLSEGVDVPALDGVVFCEPRQSVIDVVQSLGRVMRKSPGKSIGYVIVPVVVSRNEAIEHVINRDKSNKLILRMSSPVSKWNGSFYN